MITTRDAVLRDFVALLELLMYFDKKQIVRVGDTQLHPSEAHLLKHAIAGASFTEMALRFGISKPAVSRAFKRLADKGIVKIEKDRADKNRAVVHLTRKGKPLLAKVEQLQRDLSGGLATRLDAYDAHDMLVVERMIADLIDYVRGALLTLPQGGES